MTRQLSRPLQIALAAVFLFAAVWFLALRAHSVSPGGSGSSAGTPAPPAAGAAEKTAASPTPIYKGPVPGVAGVSRAIDKAHGAGSSVASNGSPAGATAPGGAPARSSAAPARQALVEGALRRGEIAVVLFWSPQGADDLAVRAELQRVDKGIAVFEASPSEVTSFGSITRTVRVYQTPTILIVNPRGQATTLTGLTDAYSIQQAIDTLRSG